METPPLEAIRDLFSPSPDRTPTPILAGSARLSSSEESASSKSKSTSRNLSPSPLFASESGWLAGKMSFSPFGSDETSSEEPGSRSEKKKRERRRPSWGSDQSRSSESTPLTSQEGKTEAEGVVNAEKKDCLGEEEQEAKKQKIGSSKLAPTAQPFVFSPKPIQAPSSSPPPPFARLSPIKTSAPPRHSSLPFPSTQASIPLDTPPHSALPHFDASGHLNDQYSSYSIADEILRLQTSLAGG